MTVRGWASVYDEIVAEFGLDKERDYEAALILDGIITEPVSEDKISELIRGRTVHVIGAGDSLPHAIPTLKKHCKVTKIAADSAVATLIENGIRPDIVVTDLDGDESSLLKAARTGAIMLVHAHGDNAGRLHLAERFGQCMGTAQGEAPGKTRNFGGFTDGDRCVFLASHFGASKTVLFGMDLAGPIGAASATIPAERTLKRKKLRRAMALLEWLAGISDCKMYTTSGSMAGFRRVSYGSL